MNLNHHHHNCIVPPSDNARNRLTNSAIPFFSLLLGAFSICKKDGKKSVVHVDEELRR
jgi:hypothetical protein